MNKITKLPALYHRSKNDKIVEWTIWSAKDIQTEKEIQRKSTPAYISAPISWTARSANYPEIQRRTFPIVRDDGIGAFTIEIVNDKVLPVDIISMAIIKASSFHVMTLLSSEKLSIMSNFSKLWPLRKSEYILQKIKEPGYFKKQFAKCDCGGNKAKTTCANWCSTRKQ